MGLTVAEVTNGRLALSWLAENPAPALILLDLMMPEMDGFEFLDTFNSRAEWRHVPVVVITAKQLTAAERGLLSGAYRYRKRRFDRQGYCRERSAKQWDGVRARARIEM